MTALFRRFAGLALFALLLAPATLLAQSDQVQEPLPARTVALDDGIVFTLPAGWEEVEDEREDTRANGKGRLWVYFHCISEECRHSQETCSFSLRTAPVEGADGTARLKSLFASPKSRYDRMRTSLISTSKDSTFRQPMTLQNIGRRDWYIIETDARHNMKSGLFAETVIDGRRLTVTCKTCETGDIRHRNAMAMLESLRQE